MRRFLISIFLVSLVVPGFADDMITREYLLKNADATNIIPVLNFLVVNPTGKRIMGGQGKKLVVTETIEAQDTIAQLLPIIDKPTSETTPSRIRREMAARAANFMQNVKSPEKISQNPAPASQSGASTSDVHTYDTRTSTQPYKSVYSDEDAKLAKGPRYIHDEPVLLSLSTLTLKGIFMANTKSPLALLSFEGVNYTARDGGLFESNRTRLKGITSEVRKDSVVLKGPDRIPHEIKFKSTL